MATFASLPGTLNIKVKRGDTFSTRIDFSIALTGYQVTSELLRIANRTSLQSITTNVIDDANGIVDVSMSASETAALGAGTYVWQLTWQTGSQVRTAIEGFLEVVE
jgi:hypothetical protein